MKLWAGRFQKETDALVNDFNSSISFDARMYREDITGSIAHAAMLGRQGIIKEHEAEKIIDGLKAILADIEAGQVEFSLENEDIHMNIETILTQRIGDTGKRLHTARSRNDQCNVDMKLYVKQQAHHVAALIDTFCATLQRVAEENPWMMPGYTHLQRAQVVTFKYHLMAYCEMMLRDKKRLLNAVDVMDESPLGCGALAGTTHIIDRSYTAQLLGFSHGACKNFLDGVSDRDFVLEVLSDFSILMMHLSRLAEELILWSSAEFGFVVLDDKYTTGSSIMPQKKNPDVTELIRGKTGRVYGDLNTLLVMMKGIPLAYDKDMQEDKEAIFDAVDTLELCLRTVTPMLATMTPLPANMRRAAAKGFINATDCADYLTKKGMPFRDAYKCTGTMVAACIREGKTLEELTLDEFKQYSDLFEDDVYTAIDLTTCCEGRTSYGGPTKASVMKQVADVKGKLA